MRNHAKSDHHIDHNYDVMADDIVRFADKHHLSKFTLLGHSMGGRTALTTLCKYPDRVDGAISVDAAPVNEFAKSKFGSFAKDVLKFMWTLKQDETLTRSEA